MDSTNSKLLLQRFCCPYSNFLGPYTLGKGSEKKLFFYDKILNCGKVGVKSLIKLLDEKKIIVMFIWHI